MVYRFRRAGDERKDGEPAFVSSRLVVSISLTYFMVALVWLLDNLLFLILCLHALTILSCNVFDLVDYTLCCQLESSQMS